MHAKQKRLETVGNQGGGGGGGNTVLGCGFPSPPPDRSCWPAHGRKGFLWFMRPPLGPLRPPPEEWRKKNVLTRNKGLWWANCKE